MKTKFKFNLNEQSCFQMTLNWKYHVVLNGTSIKEYSGGVDLCGRLTPKDRFLLFCKMVYEELSFRHFFQNKGTTGNTDTIMPVGSTESLL